ncbi:membrane bound O-acyl transferase family-domain-containing protein [Aspergillus alliaceus]|uniref:Membrane bound O-acyl transferase family-domain-containing protein n=1 Tax=Petromyces alliaceus TaxID=209559 RepID=A0A5N7CQ51_PETAA|nr:membrane bound O-acyl transferase family-domain-containing protein [Aspergillus alliaceus]
MDFAVPVPVQKTCWVLPLCYILGHYLLCAFSMTYTQGTSPWRRLYFILALCLVYLQTKSLAPLIADPPIKAVVYMHAFLHAFHILNLLLILKPCESRGKNLLSALYLLLSYRGIQTKWQAKNTPMFPLYFSGRATICSLRFCLRQCVISLWQLVVFGHLVLASQQLVPAKTTCGYILAALVDRSGLNIGLWVVMWVTLARIVIDSTYRLASVVFVATGICAPETWPPFFNSVFDAWTLRRFWGRYWHQLLRWPFTAAATIFVENICRLSKPGLLERYLRVFCVFTLSGVLHSIFDICIGVPLQESGAFRFFCGFTLGFMIEDGVQSLWAHMLGKSKGLALESEERIEAEVEGGKTATPLWQKVVGYIWVCTWLSMTTGPYIQPLFSRLCQHGVADDFVRFIELVNHSVSMKDVSIAALCIWLTFGPFM